MTKKTLYITDAPADVTVNMEESNYVKLLSQIPAKYLGTGLHHMHFYHDDWCAIYKLGNCDCDVEVVIKDHTDRFVLYRKKYKVGKT